jgi:glycosyltransferase involved in cell wall biosynthesis
LRDFKSGGLLHIASLVDEWKKLGISVIIVGEKSEFSIYANTITLIKRLFALKGSYKLLGDVDFIIAPSPYPLEFFTFLKVANRFQKKGFVYFHLLPPHPLWKPLKRGVARSIVNFAYFYSAIALCKIFGFGVFLDQPQAFNLGSLRIIRDDDALKCDTSPQNVSSKDFDVFYVGRIQKSKGVLDLIKALVILGKKGLELKVVIAGEANGKKYYGKILKLKNKHHLDNVILTGAISDDLKRSYYQKSKVFVFPSYEDSWSLAVMEAAYYRLPVVAYELPAYSYLKNNYFRVKVGDIVSLANTIVDSLQSSEPSRLQIEKAQELVVGYRFDQIAKYQLSEMARDSEFKKNDSN